MIEVMRQLPGSDAVPSWKPLYGGPQVSASFTCPAGHKGVLLDHEISADGTVQPSVVCPQDGCTFHDFVRLAGWPPAPTIDGVPVQVGDRRIYPGPDPAPRDNGVYRVTGGSWAGGDDGVDRG